MLLEIPEQVIKRMQSRAKSRVIKESRAWSDEKFDHLDLEPEDLPLLEEYAQGLTGTNEKARRLMRRLGQLKKVGKGHKHRNLEVLAEEMRKLVADMPNRWIFIESKNAVDVFNPYIVTNVGYSPPDNSRDYYIPAHIDIQANAIRRGDQLHVGRTIQRDHLTQETDAEGIFALAGMLVETPELVKEYQEACELYTGLQKREGIQLVGEGVIELERDSDSYWKVIDRTRMDRDGKPGRVVLDDTEGWESDRGAVTAKRKFSKVSAVYDDGEEEILGTEALKLPEHPYIRIFDMRTHSYGTTHVRNVSEYIYNRKAFDRVIMPPDTKELIDALVMSDKVGDDIMAGKGKGVIILSSGPPGTGKTLTAEAYSERAGRPLYPVQCSQLGLEPAALEKELATVLERAMRWGAILLLDEADVYIRSRGDDIKQNAVVGVFLRLLEYYTGVLFMTTNRETMVDDAILSRCIVHIKYKVPTLEESEQIWCIMFDQFVGESKPKLVKELAGTYLGVSGRTIKNMTRLAKTMSDRRKVPLDLESFRWISRYQDMEKVKCGTNAK